MGLFIVSDVKVYTFIEARPPHCTDTQDSIAYPYVDIIAKNHVEYIYVELPAVKIEDISIFLYYGYISIEVEKHREECYCNRKFLLSERQFGSFRRVFKIPIKTSIKEVALNNGVLCITLNID